jgi:hypothetical protein
MIRKALSLTLLLVAVGPVFGAIMDEMPTRRLAWIVLAAGTPMMALTLHPEKMAELLSGLGQGVDEFMKATRDFFD